MQVLLCKRPGLMNGAAAHGQPVEKRRAAHIKELPEEVLVQLHRGFRIAPQSEFDAGIENNASIAQMQHRRYTYVENGVKGVVVDDGQLAGNGNGPAEIALAKVAANGQEVLRTVAEGAAELCYLLRPRWRRGRSPEEFIVQLVDGSVFKHGFRVETADHGGVRGNGHALITGCLDQAAFGNFIFSGKLVGVRIS